MPSEATGNLAFAKAQERQKQQRKAHTKEEGRDPENKRTFLLEDHPVLTC